MGDSLLFVAQFFGPALALGALFALMGHRRRVGRWQGEHTTKRAAAAEKAARADEVAREQVDDAGERAIDEVSAAADADQPAKERVDRLAALLNVKRR